MYGRVLLAAASIAAAVWAAPAAGYTVKGSVQCPEAIQEDADEEFRLANQWWLLGYLTGRNYELDRDVGRGVDVDTVYAIAIDFCARHPDADWDEAAIYVYDVLGR